MSKPGVRSRYWRRLGVRIVVEDDSEDVVIRLGREGDPRDVAIRDLEELGAMCFRAAAYAEERWVEIRDAENRNCRGAILAAIQASTNPEDIQE